MSYWIDDTTLVSRKATKQRFRKRIINAWDSTCYVCGMPQEHITLDHLRPKAHGGTTSIFNLAPCCSLHNRQKGHNELWSWWTQHECWDLGRAKRLISYLKHVYLEELISRPWDAPGDIELLQDADCLPFLTMPDDQATAAAFKKHLSVNDDFLEYWYF